MSAGLAAALVALAGLLGAQDTDSLRAGQGGEAAIATPRDGALEARATRVAAELRCPVCQGLSIEDSPSPLALQMKQLIRDQLAAGRTEEQVKAYFTSRYGEWVLLEPEPAGFNLLVYVLPVLALLAGVGVVVLAVRRWTRPLDEGAA